MTPETKVGLLVGLGAIVVFAVVLSHTGQSPELGDMPLAMAEQERTSPVDALPRSPIALDEQWSGGPVVAAPLEHGTAVTDEPAGSEPSGGLDLPYVVDLETTWPEITTALTPPSGELADGDPLDQNVGSVWIHPTRLLPPPINPEPTHRSSEPIVTPPPSEEAEPAPGQPREPSPENPGIHQPPRKTYVVQKGDTLGRIADKHYGTSRKQVLELLVKSNSRIPNENTVIEGQEIVIPELPSGMFEPAPTFSAMQLVPDTRHVVLEELTVVQPRQAPRVALETGVGAATGYREYVVQPKDTLSSISEKMLGSMRHWQDIQKLNNVDPKKLRPGMKLRIPSGPVSQSGTGPEVAA